jgi:hypothetical protein
MACKTEIGQVTCLLELGHLPFLQQKILVVPCMQTTSTRNPSSTSRRMHKLTRYFELQSFMTIEGDKQGEMLQHGWPGICETLDGFQRTETSLFYTSHHESSCISCGISW